MKVEIWSDVMCPFCYIGKRNFETAMAEFTEAGQIGVEWKSFQLDPFIRAEKGKSIEEYLAERKGWTPEQARQMNHQVTGSAQAAGLEFNMDRIVVANSFDAHRLIQLAKRHHLGDRVEELLFRAYFTEGKDVGDHATLLELGVTAGLDRKEVAEMLSGDALGDDVRRDIARARQLGVRGVPFFVFNDKYGVSGAQPAAVFLQALRQSYGEWAESHPLRVIDTAADTAGGPSCTPDGTCD